MATMADTSLIAFASHGRLYWKLIVVCPTFIGTKTKVVLPPTPTMPFCPDEPLLNDLSCKRRRLRSKEASQRYPVVGLACKVISKGLFRPAVR